MSLKIGLVGCGYLGRRHLKHLTNLDGVHLTALWDTNPQTLAQAAAEFKTRPATSLNELVELSDAVDLVTPTTTHCELGLEVVAAGRPLFVEKPICATADEGRQLVQAAEAAGVALQVGHIERFNRGFRALQGLKVKPKFIEAHRLSTWTPRGVDVAVVLDLMIHDLDLVLALAGGTPDHLHASGVGVMTDTADIATARIEFSDGLVANLTASRISLKRMRKMRLFGRDTYLALDLDKGTCEHVGLVTAANGIPPGSMPLGEMQLGERQARVFRRFIEAEEGDALRLELSAFRDAVVSGGAPPVTGADGLRALELAERVIAAIKKV